MKTFFLNIISSFIGFFIASILLGLLIISTIAGIAYSLVEEFEKNPSITPLKPQSVLVIRLGYPIPEKTSDDPFDHYDFQTLESRVVLGLDDIIESILASRYDTNIEGIYLNISTLSQGWGSSEALRKALLAFKDSGKWIIAYNEYFTHSSYYISSVADQIFLNPEGQIQFQGLSFQSLFLKNTLAKLDIEMQVLRGPDNEYKSAVETFTENEMSDNSRFQTQALTDDLWGNILSNIAVSRNLSPDILNDIADRLALKLPRDSVDYGLVDELLYQDQVRALIKEKVEVNEGQEMTPISIEDYSTQTQSKYLLEDIYNADQKDQIAILYAEGDIRSGVNDDDIIGSITTSNAIRSAREDDTVKSMVLRINSPGGSALASDVILREAYLFAEEKPLVVSFGNVAASGGYYIATAGHKIFAQENTITGSIGIFGLLPNLKGFLENKIGLNFDQTSSNSYSDFGTSTRSLKAFEKQHLQKQIENTYGGFKKHVAQGRNMSLDEVENIAKGRVWSGSSAKEVGLIDEFGGLNDAINEAAALANISDYRLLKLPIEASPFSRFIKNSDDLAQAWLFKSAMGKYLTTTMNHPKILPWVTHIQDAHTLTTEKTIQAKLPFSFIIE